MTGRMQGFTHTESQMPDKRKADERNHDFQEIIREFNTERAAKQADRCAQCGVPVRRLERYRRYRLEESTFVPTRTK